MNVPADFSKTKAKGASTNTKRITGGGHVCEILKAEECFSSTGTSYLAISFDIKGGEFDGYYRAQYNADRERKGDEAKWRGVYRQFVLDRDGKCSPYFKGFIESVERSNPGYKFDGNEKTLAHKMVGLVFRNEPYEGTDGNAYDSYKPCWACEANKAAEQKEPKAKAIRQINGAALKAEPTPNDFDSDLPF